jgi:hypothetical protein
MKPTPRERMLALVQGRELDRVPYGVWRTSLKAITDAIEAFGKP